MRYRLHHGMLPHLDGEWVRADEHARLVAKARQQGFVRALKHAGYLHGSIIIAVTKHAVWLMDGDEQ